MDLIDSYWSFHPKEAKYRLLSKRIHGWIQKSLNKFKKNEIISSTFLDHNSLKLENNLKEKSQKHSNTWRLNDMLLNNELVNNKIKKEIQKYVEINESEHNNPKPVRQSKGNPGEEIHSNTGLPKEYRKIPSKTTKPDI